MAILSLLASTGNNVQAPFLVTPGTVYLRYSLAVLPSVYSVFSPRWSVLGLYMLSDDCWLTLVMADQATKPSCCPNVRLSWSTIASSIVSLNHKHPHHSPIASLWDRTWACSFHYWTPEVKVNPNPETLCVSTERKCSFGAENNLTLAPLYNYINVRF